MPHDSHPSHGSGHSHDSCCSHSHAKLDIQPAPLKTSGPVAGARTTKYRIPNMDCPTEERLIRNKLDGMAGVVGLDFNLMNRVLDVHHHLDDTSALIAALKAIGMQAVPVDRSAPVSAATEQHGLSGAQKSLLAVSGLTAAAAEVLAWTSHTDHSPLVIVLALISIASGGLPTLKKGWIALKSFTLNINFLMCLAVFGALAIGQWPEAAMVIFLFAIAELIEGLSLDRARNAVHGLMQLAPDVATVSGSAGAWSEVPVASVKIGDLMRIKPGERIALDGVVASGVSSVNQAPITGESMPVDKRSGDTVYAGTINQRGLLEVTVSANSGDSTLAKIVRVIEETQGKQAPTQRFVDSFARYYTPAVVLCAVLVAILPPLLSGAPLMAWVYKALVMLVIACPCALVISTPVTVVSGLTAAARRGILVKGGQFLETGHRLKAIALDKTGTLTLGRPSVTDVLPFNHGSRDALLLLAASLDSHSDHPLAHAIVKAGPASGLLKTVMQFQALPGRGVQGDIDGVTHYLGNQRLMSELGLVTPQLEAMVNDLQAKAYTAMVLATKEAALGLIAVADVVRPKAADAIRRLNALGVTTVMLTGDNHLTAQRIGGEVGISLVKSELLPEQKLSEIQELQAQFGAVGMLGDGINDAPALAQSDIGFAMGAAGSDTAIETADVALMDDELGKLPEFIMLSRRTRSILLQNISFAIGIKAVFFALALAGLATLWMAVFADVGASLIVVANGLRLLRGNRYA
ncbi:heavy metal translocating P-type ATPase [Janthinobacterium agaricidamnosum]|uniref:P-type Zn(2+) transporter n=1 Tax=Janthinobacterium agaricidamnosum NBRC 102515 = DSM 9628 TaxID=1349767 RepID=W0V784_9BURK|nr:heavy metal translocating P-type ATPase [Janthinobacterium agaricidamnosum]CDG83218.1 cadmium-translocating P-type ATPase [Janthinobacterium agaricidamnosum NBRC 102515 = DSM 9628]